MATPVITDEFNRANSTSNLGSCDQGIAWVQQIGTWGITSNSAYSPVSGTPAVATLNHGWSDGAVNVVLPAQPGNGQGAGVALRLSDTSNFWFAFYYTSGGGSQLFYLRKRVAGADTDLLSAVSVSVTFPLTVSVTAVGNLWHCRVNGTEVTGSPVTDAFNSTQTNHGLNIYGSSLTTDTLQNYYAEVASAWNQPIPILSQRVGFF